MVTARVEVHGVEQALSFLANPTTWSARAVVDHHRAGWPIESLFKLRMTIRRVRTP